MPYINVFESPERLKKFNSLTKYPSIPTYHEIVNGKLQNNLTPGLDFYNKQIEISEKIDGENLRICFIKEPNKPVDYLIGSREELIYSRGDRIINNYGNMVNTTINIAENIAQELMVSNGNYGVSCFYFEIYGGKTNKRKNYTNDSTIFGLRLFDHWQMSIEDVNVILELPIERISSWRENKGQPYSSTEKRFEIAEKYMLNKVPYLATVESIPNTIVETYEYLKQFATTQAGLNVDGQAEGIVIRTADRQQIAKIRFEDYLKVLFPENYKSMCK